MIELIGERSQQSRSGISYVLGDTVLRNTRKVFNDESKSAKKLWDEIKQTVTLPGQQEISNLQNQLMAIPLDQNKSWDSLLSNFRGIIDEYVAFDQTVSEEGKAAKLIRSLPLSFEPLGIVSSMIIMIFDDLIRTVHAEIAREKSQKRQTIILPNDPPPSARFAGRFNQRRDHGICRYTTYLGCLAYCRDGFVHEKIVLAVPTPVIPLELRAIIVVCLVILLDSVV